MPRTARSVRIRQIAESCGWTRIGTPEFAQLREQLPSVSPTDVLRSGVPADPPWRAIRQHTFPELAEDLLLLADLAAQVPALRKQIRTEVIRAKDLARIIAKSPHVSQSTRTLKAEMVDAILVWLDDPALFREWISVRLARG